MIEFNIKDAKIFNHVHDTINYLIDFSNQLRIVE